MNWILYLPPQQLFWLRSNKRSWGALLITEAVVFDTTSEPRNRERNWAIDDIFFFSHCSPWSIHRVSRHLPCVNKLSAHIIFSTSTYNWPYVSPAPCHWCCCRCQEERKRSRLWQGDCWMALPWTCQVRFILVKGQIWAHRVRQTPPMTVIQLLSYFYLVFYSHPRSCSGEKKTHQVRTLCTCPLHIVGM